MTTILHGEKLRFPEAPRSQLLDSHLRLKSRSAHDHHAVLLTPLRTNIQASQRPGNKQPSGVLPNLAETPAPLTGRLLKTRLAAANGCSRHSA